MNRISRIYMIIVAAYAASDIYFLHQTTKALERKIALSKIALLTRNQTGDYLEFGVYQGASMIQAYQCIAQGLNDDDRPDKNCRFIGFDSFEGLPEITTQFDRDAGWRQGDYSARYESVRENLLKYIPEDKLILVKGFYRDTLNDDLKNQLGLKHIKGLMIDCDLYESSSQALIFCEPYLGVGSVIIFDDYYANFGDPSKGGEALAFQEFINRTGYLAHEYAAYGFDGRVFILHSGTKFSNPKIMLDSEKSVD